MKKMNFWRWCVVISGVICSIMGARAADNQGILKVDLFLMRENQVEKFNMSRAQFLTLCDECILYLVNRYTEWTPAFYTDSIAPLIESAPYVAETPYSAYELALKTRYDDGKIAVESMTEPTWGVICIFRENSIEPELIWLTSKHIESGASRYVLPVELKEALRPFEDNFAPYHSFIMDKVRKPLKLNWD